MACLPMLIDLKGKTYNSIQVILNWPIKIVHYEPVKIIINTHGLAEIIMNMIVRNHDLSNSIVND